MTMGKPGEATGAGFDITLRQLAAVGANSANTTVRDEVVCPRDCTVTAVKGICNASYASTATLDLFVDGVTILSTIITLAADDTAYSAVIAKASEDVDEDAVISLRVVTGASGEAAGITMTVHCENRDVS